MRKNKKAMTASTLGRIMLMVIIAIVLLLIILRVTNVITATGNPFF